MNKKQIGVVGVGRLGLCFALLLDRAGYPVMGCDIRSNYISNLQRREIHTAEPEVSEMLKNCDISFTTDTRMVLENSDIIYIMVATPSLADGSYDISAIQRVIDDITDCDFDLEGKLLVIGCTTNPGDCQRIQDRLRNRGMRVLYNPEFIAQGSIIRDLQQADMVLIGAEHTEDVDCYRLLYDDIQTIPSNVHTMSLTAAEIVKIGINCFLTTKISYANMIGQVLTRSGLDKDVDLALTAIGTDSRVGHKYMRYGFGYGGPCLPRDNRAFAHYASSVGSTFALGLIVDQFNHDHTVFLVDEVLKHNQRQLPFYMESVTYKPNTDIIEESQPLRFCQALLDRGHRVFVRPSNLLPDQWCKDLVLKYSGRVEFKSLEHIAEPVYRIDI